ncbi:hypothetical protein SISSUDRAFT_334510 [Sistotremastrum suecicum HHB10207 ss-3]|uniref:BTB domain-containing protein n=1 Tax=Sistotremastrum suecicum HHB10207 ss-3 TaxID=1314776 RepID=A0A166IVF7_9AGAM|nr:hypothetical protein SISSUDRAFT_334510 [Sistotremastrum suecicum HHB10207 ss-3]
MSSASYSISNGVSSPHPTPRPNGAVPGPSRAQEYNDLESPAPSASISLPAEEHSGLYHENGVHEQNNHTDNQGAAITDYIYEHGFMLGEWADTIVQINSQSYNLHALLLVRSPYLAHLLATSPPANGPRRSIYLPTEQLTDVSAEIAQEGLLVALGYLYSPTSLRSINTANARGVLAAGCLLGGMNELCVQAYEMCQQSISAETIDDWIQFADKRAHLASTQGEIIPNSFDDYANRLRAHVMQFIIVDLPSHLHAFSGEASSPGATGANGSMPADGMEILLNVYSRIPFDIFKAAVESPALAVGSDQARFRFAKSAINLRKKGVARQVGAEETVVLAFGGSASGTNVHVSRKLRKKPLWKVSQ